MAAAKGGSPRSHKSLAHEEVGNPGRIHRQCGGPGIHRHRMDRAITEDKEKRAVGSQPMGAPRSAADVAATVLFLCSATGGYHIFTGEDSSVNGGITRHDHQICMRGQAHSTIERTIAIRAETQS